jgi:ketosteroid isomerase-like protein
MKILRNTEEYVAAFDQKNLDKVAQILTADAKLFDPANPNGIEGRDKIIEMIHGLFSQTKNLSFTAKNIFVDGENSIIEFVLKLDDKVLQGVDVIEWRERKIKELRAYLY